MVVYAYGSPGRKKFSGPSRKSSRISAVHTDTDIRIFYHIHIPCAEISVQKAQICRNLVFQQYPRILVLFSQGSAKGGAGAESVPVQIHMGEYQYADVYKRQASYSL